jgi:hypothetical protein
MPECREQDPNLFFVTPGSSSILNNVSQEQQLVKDLIDASVENHEKAERLLSEHPELRDARWLHGETVLHS